MQESAQEAAHEVVLFCREEQGVTVRAGGERSAIAMAMVELER